MNSGGRFIYKTVAKSLSPARNRFPIAGPPFENSRAATSGSGILLDANSKNNTVGANTLTSNAIDYTDSGIGQRPTLSSCGGGGPAVAANSTNMVGYATAGTTTTSCTINFAAGTSFSTAPDCTVTDYAATPRSVTLTAPTATGFTVNNLVAGDTFSWLCSGH